MPKQEELKTKHPRPFQVKKAQEEEIVYHWNKNSKKK